MLATNRTLCISNDESEVQLKLVPLALAWPESAVGTSLPPVCSLWELLSDEDQDALEADPEAWPVTPAELQAIDVCNKSLQDRWGMDFRSFHDSVLKLMHFTDFRNLLGHLPSWAMVGIAGTPRVNSPDAEMLKVMFQKDSMHMHAKLCSGQQLFPIRVPRARLDSVLPADTQYSAAFAILEPDMSVWLRSPRNLPTADAIRASLLQSIWVWKVSQKPRRATGRRVARRRSGLLSPGAGTVTGAGAGNGEHDSDSSRDDALALRQAQVSTLFSRGSKRWGWTPRSS